MLADVAGRPAVPSAGSRLWARVLEAEAPPGQGSAWLVLGSFCFAGLSIHNVKINANP